MAAFCDRSVLLHMANQPWLHLALLIFGLARIWAESSTVKMATAASHQLRLTTALQKPKGDVTVCLGYCYTWPLSKQASFSAAHFWICQNLGGVKHCQDGNGHETYG